MNREEYEKIQHAYCSNSRKKAGTSVPGRMGKRVIRNALEACKYFRRHSAKEVPVLDVGCGDGLAMEVFKKEGFTVYGLEVVQQRVAVARSHGLEVIHGAAEEAYDLVTQEFGETFNIFCAHVLEHTQNQPLAIDNLKRLTEDVLWMIVPVELRKVSPNIAHASPVKNLQQLKKEFGGFDFKEALMGSNFNITVARTMDYAQEFEKIYEEYRFNVEREGVLAYRRR